MTRFHLSFLLIFGLAAMLRFWQLGQIPLGITPNEAAISYNAYSISRTQADEYGRSWPLFFDSFGDIKLPLSVYMLAPVTWAFGLDMFVVRFPFVVLGLGSVVMIYALVSSLFNNRKLALVTMLVIAVSPWHVQVSRAPTPEVISLFLVLAASWLFVRSSMATIGAAVLFTLTYFVDTVMWLFVPLWFLGLLWWQSKVKKISLLTLLVTVIVIVAPLVLLLTSVKGQMVLERSIISFDESLLGRVHHLRNIHQYQGIGQTANIFANKYLQAAQDAAQQFFYLLDPNIYFFSGHPRERVGVAEMEKLPFFQLPFLALGILLLAGGFGLTLSIDKSVVFGGRFLIFWWLAAVLASLTFTKNNSAEGTLVMIIPLVILIGLGCWWCLQKRGIILVSCCVAIGLVSFSLTVFYIRFFNGFTQVAFSPRQSAYHQIMQKILKLESQFTTVKVSDEFELFPMLIAFYSGFDPKEYQRASGNWVNDRFGNKLVPQFGKYHFTSFLRKEAGEGRTLYVDINRNDKRQDFVRSPAEVFRFPLNSDYEGVVYNFKY